MTKPWGIPKEVETRRRIRLSIWAYAYESKNVSLVPDGLFDPESMMVDLTMMTDRPDLDAWFRKEFEPCTGMWIHKHPELDRIEELYINHVQPENVASVQRSAILPPPYAPSLSPRQ